MNIQSINGGWFFDDITARGVSFDGFLPQACKTPLGNMKEFDLIHTPQKMADFQNNGWYVRNWSLGDTLLTISPLQSDKHVLVDAYQEEIAKILSSPCDLETCEHDASCGSWPSRGSCRGLNTLREDLSRYGDVMTGNNDLDDGKFYDVKKEIYRLTDRVFAALAKCYEIDASGVFAILDVLYKREIISSEARDNFASASAIAIKLRISTYIKAGKQGEKLMASSNEQTRKLTSVYHMPNDEQLFHFFFIAIPLYEELQQFKAAGCVRPCLVHRSFFDDSDVTMGHVYCRLLNYAEALKCYQRALQRDSEKLSIEIRRIRISLFITKDTEVTEKIQENLDTLLWKINQSFSQSHHNSNQTMVATTPFVNLLDMEECRQLLEVLLFASSYYDCHKYFALAEKILAQCLAAEKSKRSAGKELLMMKFAFMNFYTKYFHESLIQQHNIDVVTSELTSLIDEEGVNTKSIVWLNKLGEFLFIQGKFDKAYRCFQRALSMEYLLYGTKPNVNMMTSLNFLGMTSMYLFMYMESQFYFELLLQLYDSFGGPTARLMVKHTYLQLALLGVPMGYSVEKTVRYLENGLKVTTGIRNDTELILDCVIYCQLATTWHDKHNYDQAWKSVLDGKTCLRNIVGVQARVTMTCLIAMTLGKIRKANEGIVILKEEVQKLTSQSYMEQRAFCMMNLGKLCEGQGLASDAKNYYKQALDVLVEMQNDKHIFHILECLTGISKTIMVNSRVSEARIYLDQAFNLAKKLTASKKKCSFLQEIGELYRNLCDINRARQCFDEAIRTCKESDIAKKLPFMQFQLEVKLGEMANNTSAVDSANHEIGILLEQRLQAQRSHYDRAADVLRQHVATGQVDSTTVMLFLSLASKFTSVDLGEKIELLLEALQVCEIVYGTNKQNEMITTVLGQISDTYWMAGDKQAATKYRELLLRMEMELHLSNPVHEHISHNLASLSLCFLENPGDINTIQRAYEFLLFAQKDAPPTNGAAKAAAARCFTSLGVLFYALGDLEKAETLNEMASQIFSEICVEKEKLLCKTTCEIMKKILTNSVMTQNILPSHKKELLTSIIEVFIADNNVKTGDESLFKQVINPRQCGGFEEYGKEWCGITQAIATEKASLNSVELSSLPTNHKNLQQGIYSWRTRDQERHKERLQSTLDEDPKTSENCSSGRENLKSLIRTSVQSSDGVKPGEGDDSDSMTVDILAQTLSQIRIPVNQESLPDALVSPESIKSTTDYLCRKLDLIESKLPSLATLTDSLEYNKKIGNLQQVARISTSFQSQLLSVHENCPFDSGEKLIKDAIKEKGDNKADIAVRYLDLALQLPSNWSRKAQILKLRGECYLSMGDCRIAVINLTEAARFFSNEALENRDYLCEYLKVLIGLIKSELLCQNVVTAWRICQEGIKLVSDHELGETIHLEAVELFYLGAKCVAILSESAENKDDKLGQACSLCQQALALSHKIDQKREGSELMEELGNSEHGEFFALKCEIQLLLAGVFLKLQKEEEATRILEEMKEFLINIAVVFESLSENYMAGGTPEFLKISRRLFSWIGRVLVIMCDETEVSVSWLNKSLLAFFSAALPDTLSCYEEFLPLIHAVTITKSNAAHESHSPFQQAVDMCKEASVKHFNDLYNFYAFLKSLANLYLNLGRTEEAIVVAETGLGISDLLWGSNISDRMNNRSRMLLYLAQSHQINSTNSACDSNKEISLAEKYYLTDRGSTGDFALRKDLSYANFLCEQRRFAEADIVLRDINNLGKLVWNRFVFCNYFVRAFYGPGVQKSVEIDGELLATVGDILYSSMVPVLVAIGKKDEAVAACENLTANSVDVHKAMIGQRRPCVPYLIEACHRELLSLASDEERKQLQNCDFPLSRTNLAKLYYILNEYTLALKYFPKDVESPDLVEMKISCLRSAGNDLVETNRRSESHLYFVPFLAMLQTKEGLLDQPFHNQCEFLEGYSFANQYYVFRSLGRMLCARGNVDGAIKCYERCLDLDEDFTCDQNLVATLAELYQTKALTVEINNQDSCKRQMNLALNLFQKLLQTTGELTTFVECSFASLLSKLERYKEAVEHFENVIKRSDETFISFADEDKPLLDVHLRREIEVSGRINIPIKVRAFYEIILTYMNLNEIEKAQEIALQLENYVARFQSTPTYSLALSVVGYAHKVLGNKENAAEIFISVLEIIPEHLPVTEALESCCM